MSITTTSDGISEHLQRYLWLLWVIWLAFLAYPLNALIAGHPPALRVALVVPAAAGFAAVYTWNIRQALQQLRRGTDGYRPWPPIIVLIAIALALTLFDRRDWVELFIFVIVSLGPSLPPRRALFAIAVFVLLAPLLGIVIHAGVIQMAQMIFQSAVSGIAVVIVTRVIVLDRELRRAKDEIARLAVSEERLRFARDLHDLLGHSLSLIALKSELARKLATIAPERAAGEMQDVEQVARTALQEVREAVAGYRQPGLASEIENARQILAAANIALELENGVTALPAATEATLSWIVREGVTNVIKHSRATHCRITIAPNGGNVAIAIRDDGIGKDAPDGGAGCGMRGLVERVQAAGGWYQAGPAPDGGFVVLAELPDRKDVREGKPATAALSEVSS